MCSRCDGSFVELDADVVWWGMRTLS